MPAPKKMLHPKILRKNAGLNQTEFWAPIGVTQSAASRYEGGRRIPKPVLRLLYATYVMAVAIPEVELRP